MAELCELCGRREATDTHHLIFGWDRQRADEDNLTIKCCRYCHTLSSKPSERIHDNPRAEDLSKMLGQMMWERNYLAAISDEGKTKALADAREAFMDRYGKSFL